MLYCIKTKLSDEDYFDFNLFVNFCTPYGKKQFEKARILLSIIPLWTWLLGVLFSHFENIEWFALIVDIVLSVIVYFVTKPFMRFVTKCNCKRMMKKAKVPFTPESTMEFYDDFFVEESPETRTEVKYSSIIQVYQVNSKMIYLFNSTFGAYIIPVSSFANAEEYNSFVNFIATKTTPVISKNFK